MVYYICSSETTTHGVETMFKVVETIETVKHESNNPELETEQTVFTVYLDGVACGVSIGQDYTDDIIADIISENPELASLI